MPVGRRIIMVVLIGSFLIGGVFAVGSDAVGKGTPKFGTLPDDVTAANAGLNLNAIPEFIAVDDGEGGIAGYVKRDELWAIDESSQPVTPAEALAMKYEPRQLIVYDTNESEVGLWVDGVGFVPEGQPIPKAVEGLEFGADYPLPDGGLGGTPLTGTPADE